MTFSKDFKNEIKPLISYVILEGIIIFILLIVFFIEYCVFKSITTGVGTLFKSFFWPGTVQTGMGIPRFILAMNTILGIFFSSSFFGLFLLSMQKVYDAVGNEFKRNRAVRPVKNK